MPQISASGTPALPWPDGTFDIVQQHTVFTSILDPVMKGRVCAEMLRVLKPSGAIIWYDFRFNNPANPNVRGIGIAEIRSLFPHCRVHVKRVTLAPPVARRLVPISWLASLVMEQLTIFNTHYLGVIRRAALDT